MKKTELWPRKVHRAFRAQTSKSLGHLLLDVKFFSKRQSQKENEEFWQELKFRLNEEIDQLVDTARKEVAPALLQEESAA